MSKINEEDANILIQEYFVELSQKKSQEAISAGQAFLDENAKKEGVTTTASGLQYEVLTKVQEQLLLKPIRSQYTITELL